MIKSLGGIPDWEHLLTLDEQAMASPPRTLAVVTCGLEARPDGVLVLALGLGQAPLDPNAQFSSGFCFLIILAKVPGSTQNSGHVLVGVELDKYLPGLRIALLIAKLN